MPPNIEAGEQSPGPADACGGSPHPVNWTLQDSPPTGFEELTDPYTFTTIQEVTRDGNTRKFSADVDSNSTIHISFANNTKTGLKVNVRFRAIYPKSTVGDDPDEWLIRAPSYSRDTKDNNSGWDYLDVEKKHAKKLPVTSWDLRGDARGAERIVIEVRARDGCVPATMAWWSAALHDYGVRIVPVKVSPALVRFLGNTSTSEDEGSSVPTSTSGSVQMAKETADATGQAATQMPKDMTQDGPYSYAISAQSGLRFKVRGQSFLEWLAPAVGVAVSAIRPLDTSNDGARSGIGLGAYVACCGVLFGHYGMDLRSGDKYYGIGIDILPAIAKSFGLETAEHAGHGHSESESESDTAKKSR